MIPNPSLIQSDDPEKRVLQEHIKAQEEMLARTTTYLMEIQQQLERSQLKLSEQNKNLELLVEQRTKDLKRTVDQLRHEMQEREKAQQELSVANHELNTLLYRSSHDYKGPICTAFGLLSLLQTSTGDAEAREYMQMLHKPLQKLDALTRITTSIAEYRQNAVCPEKADVDLVLKRLLKRYHSQLGQQFPEVVVKNTLERSLITDVHMLENILDSLLCNALHYRRLTEGHQVRIEVQPYYKQVKIKVADNGAGIPKDYQHRVFDMFFRGSVQSTGSGLGLYLSKLAVLRLGGKIELKSKEGKGTSVTVVLPNV